MGNLSCCAAQQGPIDNGIEGAQNQAMTANPDKARAGVEDNTPKVPQQEVTAEDIKERKQRAVQHTEYPQESFTNNIKSRVSQFQPALLSCIKELNTAVAYITQIFDPSEQIINLKEVLYTLLNNLDALNLYWIGIYEDNTTEKKVELLFLQNVEKHLKELVTYFQDLQKKAQTAQKKDGETELTLFKTYLSEDEQLKKIDGHFLKELNLFQKQFREYVTVRRILEGHKFDINIEFVERDLKSSLPAYMRAHFKSHKGFTAWSELFGANFDVSKEEFVEVYAKKCGIEAKQLNFIILKINTICPTISFFEFQHFIKENDQFFDVEGIIEKSKHEEIQDIIKDLEESSDKEDTPETKDDITTYSNEAKFEGKLDEKKQRSGKGKLTFREYTFEGEFVNNLPEGHGVQVKFGVKYTGNFKNGLFHGEGVLSFPDGSTYTGAFENNKYHGKGTYVDYNQVAYEGQFINGALPKAVVQYTNGQVYNGELMFNRFRHGHGYQQDSNKKDIFTGEYKFDEQLSGKQFLNGELLFEGDFCLSEPTQGTYYYQGGKYNGDFNIFTHQRVQKGTLSWHDNQEIVGQWYRDAPTVATNFFDVKNRDSRYEGQWENFNRQGKGQFFYASGAKYDGDIQKNLRIGRGVYIFKNGNKYDGEWSENDFNGKGVFTFTNGDVYEGEFKDGNFHGEGKYTYANKSCYQGSWEKDQWHGFGKFTNEKGEVKQGNWVHDKLEKALPNKPVQNPEDVVAPVQNKIQEKKQQVQANVAEQQQAVQQTAADQQQAVQQKVSDQQQQVQQNVADQQQQVQQNVADQKQQVQQNVAEQQQQVNAQQQQVQQNVADQQQQVQQQQVQKVTEQVQQQHQQVAAQQQQ